MGARKLAPISLGVDMPNYNYLPNNKSEFPHVKNVDVYKFDNDFDYSRYDYTQMELQICTVPWDMGEAHIGARTISGIGNVVYFETRENRDAWFDAIPDDECYRFTTKFKELHRDLYIDVPIPYDVCAKHNYLRVKYNLFANDDSLVQYENEDGLREWFWFIREVEFLAPNTTRLHILDDAFQTWIYDVNVSGMVLERGHAPLFSIDADTYLSNPLANNTYLLTEDVNFGEATQVSNIDAVVLNAGQMYAFVCTTGNVGSNWVNRVPAASSYTSDGNPSVLVFCLPVADLGTLLSNVDLTYPQFKQTIQAVFFASLVLFDISSSFTFCNVTCYWPASKRVTLDLTELDKSQFGYSSEYADIAKLYTYPYSHIEITDETGTTDVIKIEDTTGTLEVSAALSLAYPFITIDAHLLGAGGNAGLNVTFKNIDDKSFNISGQWYETLRSWNVPTFGVVLDPSVEYDYSTRFDRAQRVVDYQTSQTIGIRNALTQVANGDLQIAANNATTTRSNSSAQTDASNTQTYNTGVATADNILVGLGATSTIAANDQQAAISASAGMASGIVNAVGSAVSGNPMGAVSSIAGGIIGGASTMASTAVANNLTAFNANLTEAANSAHATASNTDTQNKTNNQTSTNTDLTSIQNSLISGSNANSSVAQQQNAADLASAAQSAINNDVAQAALKAPFMFGDFTNGNGSTTRPMALFAHIVTQSKAAVKAAGDEFLRYGYRLDAQWPFNGNWNVGKYFTYWKLRDFWVTNLNVPDMYMDKLRFFLFGGVTVWRNPEDIGKRTIYENYNG